MAHLESDPALPPTPSGSSLFLKIVACMMAAAFAGFLVARAWPVPSVYVNELTNPCWRSAVRIPIIIIMDAACVTALLAILGCLLGVLGAAGRRWAFAGLTVPAAVICLITLIGSFGIGLPCHPFD
jgi:hypothetical protein